MLIFSKNIPFDVASTNLLKSIYLNYAYLVKTKLDLRLIREPPLNSQINELLL